MFSFFDTTLLEKFRKEHKIDPYRLKQIQQEIFGNSLLDFSLMTALSKEMRALCAESIEIVPLRIVAIQEDVDVVKFIFATNDGKQGEAVLMYHYSTEETNPPQPSLDRAGEQPPAKGVSDEIGGGSVTKLNRMTLCISCQIGCPVGCSFCVTGTMGLHKNLSTAEILGQVLLVNNYIRTKRGKKPDGTRHKVRNIVFMGMGEPLLNYEQVKATIPYLMDVRYLGLGRRHITISTVGIIPGLEQFIADDLPVALAFSLHAPTQELRERLIPFAKNYPLEKIMQLMKKYSQRTQNQVFYEYVLLAGINDTDVCAQQLGKLLINHKAHLNLIPYNENPVVEYKEPSLTQCRHFQTIVESYGVTVTLRGNMGRKAKGACGQLGWEQARKKKNG